MSEDYTPRAWFWVVGGDDSRFWSSADGAYVASRPAGAGFSRIGSEAELTDLLALHRLPGPVLTEASAVAEVQLLLDETARSRRYDGILSAISYRDDGNPVFAAEAAALFAWRSAVWTHAAEVLAAVQAGSRPAPGVAEFLAEMPELVWP